MRTASVPHRAGAWWLAASLAGALLGLAAWAGPATAAEPDPPGRVGRIADVQGSVSWFDQQQGQWSPAERNLPLTEGDRLSTAAQGRVELQVGSTVLRLGGSTELEVLRLDDQRMRFQLHGGSLALRVRTRELAEEVEVVTDEVRLAPQRAGHYRFDREDDSTQAGVWRGTLRIDEPGSELLVETGQRIELWRVSDSGGRRELRHDWNDLPEDSFAAWTLGEEQRETRSASTRHVSPEMTGVEELERHGRWEQHPEYGAVWLPFELRVGWAPYRDGRWVWVRPWGWTWVDAAPWGFAPFHYGRWVHWHGRWGWWPGDYAPRPVYAPALVAWVGGAHWGLSINIGGPPVGWVPLSPRERFHPYYRSTPIYVERINPRPRHPGPGWQPRPRGDRGYDHQAVPGAVTVVPRDVLLRRRPVAPAVLDEPRPPGSIGPMRPPLQRAEPPQPEAGPPPGSIGPRSPTRRESPGEPREGSRRWQQPEAAVGSEGPGRPPQRRFEPRPESAPERSRERTPERELDRGPQPEPERGPQRGSGRAPEQTPDRGAPRDGDRDRDRDRGREAERRPMPESRTEPRPERPAPALQPPASATAPQAIGPIGPPPVRAVPAPVRPELGQAAPPAGSMGPARPAAPQAGPPRHPAREAETEGRAPREDGRRFRPENRPEMRQRENLR